MDTNQLDFRDDLNPQKYRSKLQRIIRVIQKLLFIAYQYKKIVDYLDSGDPIDKDIDLSLCELTQPENNAPILDQFRDFIQEQIDSANSKPAKSTNDAPGMDQIRDFIQEQIGSANSKPAKSTNDAPGMDQIRDFIQEQIGSANSKPKKPKNYAPRKDQLREFLKYHGPCFRGKINDLSDLPKGTIDTLLNSGEFEKDKNGRWYHPEDYDPNL